MSDGTQIDLEQSSHHPPVTSWRTTGPNGCYEFFGWVAYSAKFGYNKFKVDHRGPRVMKFKDGGEIVFDNPKDQFLNLFWGELRHETLGTLKFEDAGNGIVCVIGRGSGHCAHCFAGPSSSLAPTRGCPPTYAPVPF